MEKEADATIQDAKNEESKDVIYSEVQGDESKLSKGQKKKLKERQKKEQALKDAEEGKNDDTPKDAQEETDPNA